MDLFKRFFTCSFFYFNPHLVRSNFQVSVYCLFLSSVIKHLTPKKNTSCNHKRLILVSLHLSFSPHPKPFPTTSGVYSLGETTKRALKHQDTDPF